MQHFSRSSELTVWWCACQYEASGLQDGDLMVPLCLASDFEIWRHLKSEDVFIFLREVIHWYLNHSTGLWDLKFMHTTRHNYQIVKVYWITTWCHLMVANLVLVKNSSLSCQPWPSSLLSLQVKRAYLTSYPNHLCLLHVSGLHAWHPKGAAAWPVIVDFCRNFGLEQAHVAVLSHHPVSLCTPCS